MSDTDSGSDDNEKVNENATPARQSSSDDSDSTPSHRSGSHRGSSPPNAPSEKDSDKSDSERSSASPPRDKKKKSLIASSDDEDDAADSDKPGPTTAAHIFGDDVSSSDSDDERGDAVRRKRVNSDSDGSKSDGGRKSDESVHGIRMYPEQEEEQEKELPPTIVEATISKVDCDFGDGIQFMKIPNFFSVALKPFDPETYEEDEDDDHIDDEGRNRLKLKAENTIRWRFVQDADGNLVKESNTRIVRWSDGTMSMVIGKEVFDVESVPILGNMQHLYVRQGNGLAAQKVFDRKLIFRPHSTDSETHRKVTMNMAERTRKSGQVRMVADVGSNPEQARREAVRREEEALRAALRKETQQRRTTKDRHRPQAHFLEGRPDYSDDDADITPRGRGRGAEAPLIGASDSEESESGRRTAARDTEDSDEEFRKKKQQQKKKILTSDEESN
ncbi:hypothetical protein Q1695_005976 [Nippostrongylus brasiliensis]|nr:hypothetical protein Q1695_005976 [Nippostrongylus brasiliensis]